MGLALRTAALWLTVLLIGAAALPKTYNATSGCRACSWKRIARAWPITRRNERRSGYWRGRSSRRSVERAASSLRADDREWPLRGKTGRGPYSS